MIKKILNFVVPIIITTIFLMSMSGGLTIALAFYVNTYNLYELFGIAMLISYVTFFMAWLSARGDKK